MVLPLFPSVPSNVRNLNLSHNNSHFVISWAEPAEPNGNLNYTVTLSGFSLVTLTESLSRTAVVQELEVAIMAAEEVYTRYTAVVVPETGAGQGAGENFTFTSAQDSESELHYSSISNPVKCSL